MVFKLGFSEMTLPTQTQALRNGWLDALALDFAFYSQPATSAFSQQFRIGIVNIRANSVNHIKCD